MSIDALYDPLPREGAGRTLLVMLPGAKATPQDLLQQGFARELRTRNLAVDVVAVAAHLGHYLDRSLNGHLTDDIIAPARVRHYRRIWLMGISLGGLGALSYSREHPADIAGVILLAPFLATRGVVAEVVRAGGWPGWQPGAIASDDYEREMLAWVQAYRKEATAYPALYLGYGRDDRFAATSALLAEQLATQNVLAIPGGHDWATWLTLWRQLLDRGVLGDDVAAPDGDTRCGESVSRPAGTQRGAPGA